MKKLTLILIMMITAVSAFAETLLYKDDETAVYSLTEEEFNQVDKTAATKRYNDWIPSKLQSAYIKEHKFVKETTKYNTYYFTKFPRGNGTRVEASVFLDEEAAQKYAEEQINKLKQISEQATKQAGR